MACTVRDAAAQWGGRGGGGALSTAAAGEGEGGSTEGRNPAGPPRTSRKSTMTSASQGTCTAASTWACVRHSTRSCAGAAAASSSPLLPTPARDAGSAEDGVPRPALPLPAGVELPCCCAGGSAALLLGPGSSCGSTSCSAMPSAMLCWARRRSSSSAAARLTDLKALAGRNMPACAHPSHMRRFAQGRRYKGGGTCSCTQLTRACVQLANPSLTVVFACTFPTLHIAVCREWLAG